MCIRRFHLFRQLKGVSWGAWEAELERYEPKRATRPGPSSLSWAFEAWTISRATIVKILIIQLQEVEEIFDDVNG